MVGNKEMKTRKVIKSFFGCQECKRRKIKCSNNAESNNQKILKSLPICNNCVRSNNQGDCVYLDLEEQKALRKIRKLLRNFRDDENIDNRYIIKNYIRGNKSTEELEAEVKELQPKKKKTKTTNVNTSQLNNSPPYNKDEYNWNYGWDDLMKSIFSIGDSEPVSIPEIEQIDNNHHTTATKTNQNLGDTDPDDHEALEVDFVPSNLNNIKAHNHLRREIKWQDIETTLENNKDKLLINSDDIRNFYNFYHDVSYWIFPFDKISNGTGTINYIFFDYILSKIKETKGTYELLKDPLILIILALSAEYNVVVENNKNHNENENIKGPEKYANAALQILNYKISSMANDELLLNANIGSLTITILLIVIYTSSENGGWWKEHHLAAKIIYQKYLQSLKKEEDVIKKSNSTSNESSKDSRKCGMSIQEENLFKLFKQWFPTFDLLASAITAERGVLKTNEYDYLFRQNFEFLKKETFLLNSKPCEGCINYDITSDFYYINDRNEVYNIFQGYGDVLTNLLVKLLDYIDVEDNIKGPDVGMFFILVKDLIKCREFYVRKTTNGLIQDQELGKQLFEEGGNGIFMVNSKYYSVYDISHLMHTALVSIIIFQKFNHHDVSLNGFIRQNLQDIKNIFGQLFLEKNEKTMKHFETAQEYYTKIMNTELETIRTLSEFFFDISGAKQLLDFQGPVVYTLLMLFSSVQMYALSLTPEVENYEEERIKIIGYCQLLHTQVGSNGALSSCLNFIKIWKIFDKDQSSYENLKNLKSLSDKSVPFI